MALQDPGLDIGYLTASADLSSSQFLAVKPYASADREVALESTGGLLILGILQNKPTTGQHAQMSASSAFPRLSTGAPSRAAKR